MSLHKQIEYYWLAVITESVTELKKKVNSYYRRNIYEAIVKEKESMDSNSHQIEELTKRDAENQQLLRKGRAELNKISRRFEELKKVRISELANFYDRRVKEMSNNSTDLEMRVVIAESETANILAELDDVKDTLETVKSASALIINLKDIDIDSANLTINFLKDFNNYYKNDCFTLEKIILVLIVLVIFLLFGCFKLLKWIGREQKQKVISEHPPLLSKRT